MLLCLLTGPMRLAQFPTKRHQFHVPLLASRLSRTDLNYNVSTSADTLPPQPRLVGLL